MTMGSTRTQGGASSSGRGVASTPSVGDLVVNLSAITTRLLRHEVALAKAETRTEVQAAGRAISTLAVSAGIALVALTMLSLATARGLSASMDLGWAYLIVGALWTLAAAILYFKGRSALREVYPVPERTKATLLEIPEAVTGR